jgi:hypothetical protein
VQSNNSETLVAGGNLPATLSVRALSKTDATGDRDECRGPSTPQNDSLRESFCHAQDDNL